MKNIENTSAEIVSFFFGLFVVLFATVFLFNLFRRTRTGVVDLPGISTEYNASGKQVLRPTGKVVLTNKNKEDLKTENEIVVLKGDSLWRVAKRYYGNGQEYVRLAKENGLSASAHLAVGQKLIINKSLPTDMKNKGSLNESVISPIVGNSYIVAKGDSLAKIALRAYGDSYAWTKIWNANKKNITKPSLIYSGNVLVIPRL